ncbi:hypothetical protein COV17_02160, partial [Candidatus Woesearchaeota archaeon CG10_big_fil_rev_8_21_14_0_10_36_11]
MKKTMKKCCKRKNKILLNSGIVLILLLLAFMFITSLRSNSVPGEYEPLINMKTMEPFFASTGNVLTGAAIGLDADITIQETYCGGNYSSGDWIINDSLECSDETINVTGSLTIQNNIEYEVSEFSTSSNAHFDLRGNSAIISSAIPSLIVEDTPEYTADWDSNAAHEFYIVMNETEHKIKIFTNNSDLSDKLYGIDIDDSDSSGSNINIDGDGGIDIVWGYYGGAGGTILALYNSTLVNFDYLDIGAGSGQIVDDSDRDASLLRNFTTYWINSGNAFELVIEINGSWIDKDIQAVDVVPSYTTFKNSELSTTGQGILNLTGVTLNITGDITVDSQLNVESSTIQFAMNTNGSSNFSASSGSSFVINSSSITGNDSTMYWGWQVASGSFNITNNNISYNGYSDDETYNNYFNVGSGGGLIYNNNFDNCAYGKGCLYLRSGNPTTNISRNNFTSPGSSIILSGSTGTIIEHNHVYQISLWDGTSGTINNNTFSGNGLYLGQLDGTQGPLNFVIQNNNFSNNAKIIDYNSTGNNTLIYNNEFGEIKWYNKTNLTVTASILIGVNVFVDNNSLGVMGDPVNLDNLNTSAELIFYGIEVDTAVQICKNTTGTLSNCLDCTADNNCSIASNTVKANVSSFSNYSINGTTVIDMGSDEYPYWDTNDSTIVTTYSNTTYSEFNISWQDDNNVSTVFFESN